LAQGLINAQIELHSSAFHAGVSPVNTIMALICGIGAQNQAKGVPPSVYILQNTEILSV